MAYAKTNRIIMRRVPQGAAGLGGIWDSIKGAGSSVLDFYNSSQQAQGAATATQTANKDLAAALAAQQGGGISTTTLAIGGVALAGVLFFALRKK